MSQSGAGNEADALSSTADLWAAEAGSLSTTVDEDGAESKDTTKQPGEASIASVTSQFDEFDPFRPSTGDGSNAHVEFSGGEEEKLLPTTTPSSPSTSENAKNAPATPAKASTPLPEVPEKEIQLDSLNKGDVATAGQASHDGNLHEAPPVTPKKDSNTNKGKESAKKPQHEPQSTNMATSSSSSGLMSPLTTIASAFRKRDFSGGSVGTPAKTETPVGKAAPAVLIRDKDEMADIDDSEKEAPPAMPSVSGSHSHDGNEDDSDGSPAFDFNLFLEQIRSRQAEPIAKYLRSFLKEFSKRTWGVNDQIRVINDFLDFIAIKMRENDVWRADGPKDFENAVEGMEKLVMNRVFHLTFIPALSPAQQATTQTDDLERDHVFSQRIKLFGWVSEDHLDLPKHEDTASFVDFATQELRKVNAYKAPRDKLICVLNTCKVIFGLMRHLSLEDGADTFIPFLILVVLKANPDHLISNVQYIQRFRNPDRLAGENGYYLQSLTAAISFIETMDSSALSNITQDEFEGNVERAIQSLPPEESPQIPSIPQMAPTAIASPRPRNAAMPSRHPHHPGSVPTSPTKQSLQQHLSPQHSRTSSYQDDPPRSVSPAEATRDFLIRSSDNLQKTVSKPLQALGKIFTEMSGESELIAGYPAHQAQNQRSGQTQYPLSPPMPQQPLGPPRGHRPPPQRSRSQASMRSPISPGGGRNRPPLPSAAQGGYDTQYIQGIPAQHVHPATPNRTSSYQPADFLDDSVSAEEVQAEADRQYKETFTAKVDTLANIFPQIERETLEIVLLSNGEDVERTIEAMLEMQ